MFVIVMKDRLLSPAIVCKNCPMASQSGLPRWQKGRLRCGRLIDRTADCAPAEVQSSHSAQKSESDGGLKACVQYECTMGFRVAKLPEDC